jgi:hypothetical protein
MSPADEELAVSDLLDLIDEERRQLRTIVTTRSQAEVARRPQGGAWSILENLRHLIFAEQKHLGRYVPAGRQWSPLSYTPQTMREARKVLRGTDAPQPPLSEVLSAWDELHSQTAGAILEQDSPEVRAALSGNLKHLRAHVNVVRRLVRDIQPLEAGGEPARAESP